jgi:hypothetical protein
VGGSSSGLDESMDQGENRVLGFDRKGQIHAIAAFACLAWTGIGQAAAQQADPSTVIRQIDAAVMARVNSIAGYVVTEHYRVYRGKDEVHPVAEMVVETTYRKETGKSYAIVSESGSALVRRLGLYSILNNEKTINLPGNVEKSWITSANYEMTLKPGGIQSMDGQNCLVLGINPKQKAPNLIVGNLWVDAKDFRIVRIEGDSSKIPSVFAGTTHLIRQYANIGGFSMATHARAESSTFLYGRTVVTIDYTNYRIQALTSP